GSSGTAIEFAQGLDATLGRGRDELEVVAALAAGGVQALRELDGRAGGAGGGEAGLVGELLHHPAGAAAVVRGREGLRIQQTLGDQGAVVLDHLPILVGGRRVAQRLAVLTADRAVPEAPAGPGA